LPIIDGAADVDLSAQRANDAWKRIELESGIINTRTRRRFFNDSGLETQFLDRWRSAMSATGFWGEFRACSDCELMPWSAKAQELLRSQYAAVGSTGRASLPGGTLAKYSMFGPMVGLICGIISHRRIAARAEKQAE
jgi:hypothetical protein